MVVLVAGRRSVRALVAGVALLAVPARAACPAGPITLGGHRLTAREARWLRFMAEQVLPESAAYTPATCDGVCSAEGCSGACLGAVGTWWALKEGKFDARNNPFRQSLCHRRTPHCARLSCVDIAARKGKNKATRQPTDPAPCFADGALKGVGDVCAADPCLSLTPWQVGLAGVQVYNWSDADVAAVVAGLGTTEDAVLREVAAFAKFKPGDPRYDAIVDSSGALRRSWLLRHPAVGLVLVTRDAGHECIDAAKSWCYGTGWDQTRWFAPSRDAALETIAQIEQYFATCTPPTSTTTTTTVPVHGCADIFDCNASTEVCCNRQCKPNPYAGQSVCSTLYTQACTLCRTDDDCHCNPMFPIFCDSCGGGDSIFSCVDPCS